MTMRTFLDRDPKGGLRVSVLLWLIGVPIPLILLFSLLRGCQ